VRTLLTQEQRDRAAAEETMREVRKMGAPKQGLHLLPP
jgi:hypothetical protein